MESKTVVALALALVVIISVTYVVSTSVPFSQTLSVHVINQNGVPLKGASVQGIMVRPSVDSGGFTTVFMGQTNSNGIFSTSDISGVMKGLSMWEKVLGSNIKLSGPGIIIMVTYVSGGRMYFNQGSPSFKSGESFSSQMLSGSSVSSTITMYLSSSGGLHSSINWPRSPYPKVFPNGYAWFCKDKVSSGVIHVPLAWVSGSGGAFGNVISALLFSKRTEEWNVGFAIGSGSNGLSASTYYGLGGSIWQEDLQFQDNWNSGLPGVPGYVYIDAHVGGALYQLGYLPDGPFGPIEWQNEWAYESGIYDPSYSGSTIWGGAASGSPPFINDVDQNFSYQSYGMYTGEGSPDSSPYYNIYSPQVVETWAPSGFEEISIGVAVGALLAWALGPEAGILSAILVSIGGSFSYSSSTLVLNALWFDGPSGSDVFPSFAVSDPNYNFGNGQTGQLPLFGVQVNAYYWGD